MNFIAVFSGCLVLGVSLVSPATKGQASSNATRIGIRQKQSKVVSDDVGHLYDARVALTHSAVSRSGTAHRFIWEVDQKRAAGITGGIQPVLSAVPTQASSCQAEPSDAVDFRAVYQRVQRRFQLSEKVTGYFAHVLIEFGIYASIIGLPAFALRNRFLQREIERRQQAEVRLQALADNIPGVIRRHVVYADGSNALAYMSSGCYDLWEIDAEAAVQDVGRLWNMVHPEDLARVQASLQHSAHSLNPWNCEWRIGTPSGKQKWLQVSAIPQQQEGDRVIFDGIVLDISDRKRAEGALKNSEKRLATLISNLPGFVYRAENDRDYTAKFVSEGVFDITGYRPQDYINGTISFRQHTYPADRDRDWNLVQAALLQQQPYECEYRIVSKSGEVRWVWERGRGVFDESGKLEHLEGFITDVSARKQAELALQASESRYRKVVEAQTDYILRSRPDMIITFANEALCTALGKAPEDVIGRKWTECVALDDLEIPVFQEIAALTPDSPRYIFEKCDARADGSIEWTQWLNEAIFDETGQLSEVQSVGRDITELKRAGQALRENEQLLRLITENISDLVCLHHLDGTLLYVTPSSIDLLGYSPEELMGKDPYDFVHPDDRPGVQQKLHMLLIAGRSQNFFHCGLTYRVRKKSGEFIWLESLAQTVFDDRGQLNCLQTTSRDITDRIVAEQKLKHDALHDGLTDLPNRNFLMGQLDLSLRRMGEEPEFRFAVLFLDLDNFKVINDSLGHAVGDELLIIVAEQLKTFVGKGGIAARLGGDEFVVLVDKVAGIEDAIEAANHILERLQSPLLIAEREVFVTASIGIVLGNHNHRRAEDLLRDADLAMYQAKQDGRSQYAIFRDDLHLKAMQRMHLEQDLRKALENREFLLCYQPIVTLNTLEIIGFEALIRWQHPKGGIIPPNEFVAIAEETGLIVPIGQWILNTACQQLAGWRQQFPDKDLKISVNLSAQQLKSSLLLHVTEALRLSQIPADSLVLEITESMLVENISQVQELLAEIRHMGVQLSIDDFGTGYSSLSYLHQLPVNTLKIDRAFVSADGVDTRNQVIAESIIALSNLLGLDVVAEGVETEGQLTWLRQLGCEQGQGFLFAPPFSHMQATQLLHQSNLKPARCT